MHIPKQIEAFIRNRIVLENYSLPYEYPTLESFEDFQIGYKTNAINGKNITGNNKGDFKEDWYVLCSTQASDPFFIDITAMNTNFPVYFAWHGAGNWKPIQVAESITKFSAMLELLKTLEVENNNIQKEFKKNFTIHHEFWKEVYHEYEKYEEEELEVNDTEPTAQEKRMHEIYNELIALKKSKEKGEIGLKSYLISKRALQHEMKILQSN